MKNVIITILSILVIGLCGYIVFDKFINNNNTNTLPNTDCGTNNQSSNRDSLDFDYIYYYQNYLPILVGLSYYEDDKGISFKLDDYASDEKIKWFLHKYYANTSYHNQFEIVDAAFEKTITKSELDKLTYIVFNKEGLSDYSFTFRDKFGIIKVDENTYKNVWYGTAGARISLDTRPFSFSITDDEVILESIVYIDSINRNHEQIGHLKFRFKYNSEKQTHYLTSIEEVK